MADRHVRRSGNDYLQAFLALLPQGQAWPRAIESILVRTCTGLCEFWGYVDARAADLLEIESDPRTTTELLLEWERAFGLPDPCVKEPLTVTERRKALLTRITMLGAQSREFFIGLATGMGYTVTITEYSPFMAGYSHVGNTKNLNLDDPTRYRWYLAPPEVRFYWTVHVTALKLAWFHVSSGQCGIDPLLRIGRATDLECMFERLKPAHTRIVWDYSDVQSPGDPGEPGGVPPSDLPFFDAFQDDAFQDDTFQ